MTKNRSPNYPAFTLKEAIEFVTIIYGKDMRNKTSPEIISRHLGYAGINGIVLTKIATMRSYGLLEGRSDDTRVSQRAIDLIAEQPLSDVWLNTAKDCAFLPKIFNEISAYYNGSRPSEENLRTYLIKNGFTSDAIVKITKIYLDNFEFVSKEAIISNSEKIITQVQSTENIENNAEAGLYLVSSRHNSTSDEEWSEFTRLVEGDVVFKMPMPQKLSQESLDDLEYWFGGVMKKIRRIVSEKAKILA